MSLFSMTQAEMVSHFEKIKEIVVKLFKDVSVEEFNKRQHQKQWSAAECIEHLNNAAQIYLSNIPKLPKRSSVLIDEETKISARLFAKIFIGISGPKVKVKIKSPKSMMSQESDYGKDIIDDFLALQDEFLKILVSVDSGEMKRIKVPLPAFELKRFNLGEVMMLTIAHELRHIAQAEIAIDSQ
ncbi:MAG: DinB family protein [Bacteroidota bacterium]